MYSTDKKIEYLSRFLTPARQEKLECILSNRTDALTVVLEDVYYAQNISAVIRTAECFGVQNVHIVENLHRYEVNPRIVRGAAKWIDVHQYRGSDPSRQCINKLKAQGYRIYATTPDHASIGIEKVNLDHKCAFIFGTELTGISQSAVALADESIHIPMSGFTESFNISVTVALILQYAKKALIQSGVNMRLSEERMQEVKFDWYKQAVRHSTQLLERFEG